MALNFGLFNSYLQEGEVECAKGLVTPDNIRDKNGPFGVVWHYCVYLSTDNPEPLYHFVKMGASMDLTHSDLHSSSLHAVARNGKIRMLKALLDLGAPADMFDNKFETPLCRTFYHENTYRVDARVCALFLLDAGAQLSKVSIYHTIPQWAKEFVRVREETRSTAVTILGLLRCRCREALKKIIGRDVLRIIARCVWSMRGRDSQKK